MCNAATVLKCRSRLAHTETIQQSHKNSPRHHLEGHTLVMLLTGCCSRTRWFISKSLLPEPVHEKLYQVGGYQNIAQAKAHFVDVFELLREVSAVVYLQVNMGFVSMLPKKKLVMTKVDWHIYCLLHEQQIASIRVTAICVSSKPCCFKLAVAMPASCISINHSILGRKRSATLTHESLPNM